MERNQKKLIGTGSKTTQQKILFQETKKKSLNFQFVSFKKFTWKDGVIDELNGGLYD